MAFCKAYPERYDERKKNRGVKFRIFLNLTKHHYNSLQTARDLMK